MLKRINNYFLKLFITASLIITSLNGFAASEFNFDKSTPVGSWQIREDTTIDHKGRQTVSVMKTSLLEKVDYQGAPHYWIEVEMQGYKVKKDKRKKDGDITVVKTLVDASVVNDDTANVIGNLQKYAREVIFQSGDKDPMRVTEGGAFAQAMMQAAGVKMDYSYETAGTRTVKVPAGDFKCTLLKGSGTTDMKILIKKFHIESEVESCVSEQIPFGFVQSIANITTNANLSKSETVLIEYGTAGASTKITKTPVDAPQIPKLF